MSEFCGEHIRHLIRLDLLRLLSPLERKELGEWLNESEAHKALYEKIRDEFEVSEIRICLQTDTEEAWKKVKNTTFGTLSSNRFSVWLKWQRCAAVIMPVLLSITLWYIWKNTGREELADIVRMSEKSHPVLTLDNGEKYYLQPESQTEIEVNEGAKAYHTSKGLVYDSASKAEEIRYNHIRVPRGSEYRVVLADGTRIWLNSASELRYPVAFPVKERKVFLRGEAYFEVASDKNRPFSVETGEVTIRALGTVFDVNTHYTKGVRTVLVEGTVILECGGRRNIRIRPGELVDFNRTTSEVVVKQADIIPYISWKDGFFVFEDETLEEILNALALWYDKEVFFLDQKNRNLHFSGHLKRYDRIETILAAITDVTGVEFQMNEKMILIR